MISIGSVSGIVSVDKETGISLTDQAGKDAMMAEIKAVQAEGDSVGGVIELSLIHISIDFHIKTLSRGNTN